MRGRGAIGRQRRRLTPMLCLFAERVDEVYGWTRTQDPSIVPMPLDKAIASGKEQRKPYRGSKAFDRLTEVAATIADAIGVSATEPIARSDEPPPT